MSSRLPAVARLALFVVLVFVIFPAVGAGLARVVPGGAVGYVVDHLLQLAAILVFAWLMAKLERRSFADFGLPWREALRGRFWQGAATGIVSLGLLVLVLGGAGAVHVSLAPQSMLAGIAYGAVYALLFILLALREEFLYRGYGLFTLSQLVGFWPAALVSSAWFAWSHAGNANESGLGLAAVALFGVVACFALRRSGNLWLIIGFHAAWDWGESYLFGVGDSGHPPPPGHLLTSTVSPAAPTWLSGGSVGPEGSLVCVALIALLALICSRIFPESRYPIRESST